jgi:hypothetical protein
VAYSESYNTSLMGVVIRLAFSSVTCPAIFILSEQEMVHLQTGQVACMWWLHQVAMLKVQK